MPRNDSVTSVLGKKDILQGKLQPETTFSTLRCLCLVEVLEQGQPGSST